jgi:hypothetical protein
MVGGLGLQGSLVAANASAGALALLVYPVMGVWAILALVMVLLLMRQSFSMLLSVRRAYQSTIEALVRTVEAQQPGKLGHSERVSVLATEAGRAYGLRGGDLERIAYAGLLHDLGSTLEGEGYDESGEPSKLPTASAADMIDEVTFLSDVVPVLRLQDEPAARPLGEANAADFDMAYLVLAASVLDDALRGHGEDADEKRLANLVTYLDSDHKQQLDRALRLARSRITYGRTAPAGLSVFGG